MTPMKVIRVALGIFATAGILLGIVYNLFLGFTPVWLDVTVAVTVGIAVLVAIGLGRSKGATENGVSE